MKYNRLVHFQKNSTKLSRYRLALSILYDLGIDQLLAEMGTPKDVIEDHPNIALVNALQNQRALGYKECIQNLFSLDTTTIPEEERAQADYGALDKMVSEGRISREDAEDFMKEM